MRNLKIIGTSHIAKESLERVKQEITKGEYDILCLELDSLRLNSLIHKTKSKIRISDIARIGFKGYLFSLLGAWLEKKLGEAVGVRPGAEMVAAYKSAKKKGMRIALIDQRIDITLQRFSKSITWKEKWNFLVDLAKAVIFRKPEISFDLTKVPPEEVIREMIEKVRLRYPNFYRVLVTERNHIMARNIKRIIEENPEKKILAVVGAGHEKELLELMEEPKISYGFSIG